MAAVSIQDRFAAQVDRTPDAIAVSGNGVDLTYRELAERAGRLAYRLLEEGVGPEVPVAVLMERSVDLVVAIVAIVTAGGYYLPLHEAFPRTRTQWIVDEADGPVLLTDPAFQRRGLPAGCTVLLAEDEPGPVAQTVPVDADGLAYVMHTSGSTGNPKGVGVTHRGVVGLVAEPCWDGGAHQRVLMVAPYAFSVSTYELWVPLLRGGTIVVAPPGAIQVDTLRHLLADAAITAVHLTAGLFRVVADEAPDCFTGVREVLTGGDVISSAAIRQVLDACPDTTVRVMYGATETSLFTLTEPMQAPYSDEGTVPVGRPLTGITAHVLDERLNPVADGVTGELHIGGDRLARGYVNQPDLTAQVFVADPFAGNGARLYRTGDLVRRRADGLIDFVGRANELVKIRGFRVELGEVETVLARHPALRQVSVVARDTASGDHQLVAYVVPRSGPVDTVDLTTHAAGALPDYMVPAAIVVLDALPLTPNGKIDRASLPEPPAPDTSSYRAPRDTVERTLCALFGDVLATADVGIDDSFFDLNGDSLLATRLLSRIRTELGFDLTIADLFNQPTVAELRGHIGARGENAA